jgi:defender against apopototic cell death 1
MKKSNTLIVINKIYQDYYSTPTHLMIVDAYLLYVLMVLFLQTFYFTLIGSFPFNSFLAGFFSALASLIMGFSLRLQCDPSNANVFNKIGKEKSFADFIFAHIILHLAVFNFMG